ncbi:MAG: cytochrome c3 family protein [Acidobacteria bacterium]|nr:cytochrome c3 family protein [Acidobacteriota bacterium]
MIVLAASCAAWAGKHPVPLPANVDGAKCLECHAEKAKGKAVHSAIELGCLSCHEVRVANGVTRTRLIAATPSALCISCHTDKEAATLKGKVHNPAVRDCLACHDPHVANEKNELLKPLTGGAKENLCLGCHTQGMNVPEKGSRHAALDLGCDTCHVTHKTGAAGKREFDFHLTKDAPALCLDCHDAKDEALVKAHKGQPFASADCLTCHDPHQSASPKLMQSFVHMPFGEGACDTCHQAPKNGKVVLNADSPKALCVTCHDEQAKQIASAKMPHAGAQGECTDCHNPHAGKTPGFIQPDPVNACLNCHAEQAEQHNKKYLHQPAFAQGCATCHQPHGGDNQHLLRATNVNSLCLECHGPDAAPKKLENEHLIAIFSATVRLPENYFETVPILPLKYGAGHPVDGHPVSDVAGITTKPSAPMTCLTCHQPHSGDKPGMLVKDQEANMNFCKTCHAEGTVMLQKSGGNDVR